MTYLCFGYIEENKWDAMSKDEQEAMIEECFAYGPANESPSQKDPPG
jgi:hypothetical protein